MKLEFRPTSKFKKDYKKIVKRGYDLDKLEKVITALQEGKTLDPIYSYL